MHRTKDNIDLLQLELLPGYATFIMKERLDRFVKTLYKYSVEMDIPLLRFFASMDEEEILKLSTESNIRLLTALRANTAADYIEESRSNWLRNQLPIISKDDVIGEDIGLINYARKKAFCELLPEYTSDPKTIFKILDEIDRFILCHESVLFKTYLSIQHEKLQKSNDQLKKREEELLEAQALGKIGSFEWDLTGNKRSAYTPEVFKIFEFEKTSNLEAFLNDVHPDDRLRLRGAIEKAMHDGFYECEYRYNRNNKDKILYSKGKVLFDSGKPVRMVGTVADVTEKAKLIARLTESEELSKQAQSLTATGNWKWSIDTDNIEWSDEMYKIYGLEPQSERITFQRFLTFIHDDDRSRRIAEISETIRTGIASDYIMRIVSGDGKEKVLRGKERVLKDKTGKSIGILGTCQDITNEFNLTSELKRKNEELERKNKDLESYNFIASHDLQEPLRKIQTYSSRVLHEGKQDIPEHLLKYFEKITRASSQMQRMIHDFLSFYHAVNVYEEVEQVNLKEIVDQACKDLSDLVQTKHATIVFDQLLHVRGRRIQLTQLIKHLLANAIKFSKSDTSPEIRIDSKINTGADSKKYVVILVSDNGIGFEQKYSDRIFELFQKLHSKDEYPGSGIGLSLCKKIAEDHQGWISVVSEPGTGSTFNVFLPS